jgi:hypothetical protein
MVSTADYAEEKAIAGLAGIEIPRWFQFSVRLVLSRHGF